MKRAWCSAACLLLLAGALTAACATKKYVRMAELSSPAPPALLRIEAGMHTARINNIDVDAAGRFLVTGSNDKTARVWDLASGELLQVLRPWVGDGNIGRIYAVALSPDGETVAVGGWTSAGTENVYLFERQTGRLRRRIQGLPSIVLDLAFSHDGARLAAALGGSSGLRVFDAADGRELGRDTQYRAASHGADFDATGRLVTTSYDGHVRLYGRDLQLRADVQAPGGEKPLGVAFSPDGSRIAVGYGDAPRVDLLSGLNLKLLASPEAKGTSGSLGRVAWAADGTALYAAGFWNRNGMHPIRRWSEAGSGAFHDFDGPADTIAGLRACANGQVVFGAADPAWGVLDGEGRLVHHRRPVTADFRGLSQSFGIAPNGRTVDFIYEVSDLQSARFTLAGRALQLSPPYDPTFRHAQTAALGLAVTDWRGTGTPRLNGRALGLAPNDVSRAAALAPDDQSVLLGTDWYLRSYSRTGALRWSVHAPASTWAVNVTDDSRLAVAAFGDGTIRWYRAGDGRELLAFFLHADGRRWVLWTPGGSYDTSAEGEDLIRWHVNRGLDSEAEVFPAGTFREQYRRPEVIDLTLETLDEAEALRRAGVSTAAVVPPAPRPEPVPPSPVPAPAAPPPVVTVLNPAPGSTVSASPLKVEVNVRSPSGAPVTAVRMRVDGQPVTSRGDVVWTVVEDFHYVIEVPVPPRDCVVEILAEAGGVTSAPARLPVRWAPSPRVERRLFVLAVGVSTYKDPAYRLAYAAKDAVDVEAAWKRAGSRGYDAVETRLLTDEKATREAILEALDEIQGKAGRDDVIAVFLAGHGINDGGYFFLPWDADMRRRSTRLVSDTALREALQRLPGRVALFLDTCRSGSLLDGDVDLRRRLDVTRFLNELTYGSAGLVVFSAAAGQQLSQESEAWENGAFTEALLEGLGGAADLNRNKEITAAELDLFLSDRVRALTRDAQTPVKANPLGLSDFVLVRTP